MSERREFRLEFEEIVICLYLGEVILKHQRHYKFYDMTIQADAWAVMDQQNDNIENSML